MTKFVALLVLMFSCAAFAAPISPMDNYEYTDLSSKAEMMTVWRSMKTQAKRSSECFNRALSWVYDMDKDFGIKSRKVIIHYTAKFNKELSSKWGFHIAPLLSVQGEDYVLDRKFMSEPVTKDYWLNFFVGDGKKVLTKKRNKIVSKLNKFRNRLRVLRNGGFEFGLYMDESSLKTRIYELERELKYLQVSENGPVDITCKKITNIEELDYNQTREWCYYQEVSMYYWGIPQLRLLNYGQTRTPNISDLPYAREAGVKYVQDNWDMEQVWAAREEAFSDYDELWRMEYLRKQYEEELENRKRLREWGW